MGRRVRWVVVVLLLLAIGSLAIPLALTSADRRTSELADERRAQLIELGNTIAADPDDRVTIDQVIARYALVYGEPVVVADADGKEVATSPGFGLTEDGVTSEVRRALVDEPPEAWATVLPWDSDPVLLGTNVRKDGEIAAVVVTQVDRGAAAADITRSWFWVAAGCVALLLLAIVAARALTRWVMRPVHRLERAVADMTIGEPGPPVFAAGPPELREFTTGFNRMAEAVRRSLEHQRRLVADSSHQLRNPLAAVRLRADSLDDHVAPAGRDTYAAMTGELDRLQGLLEQLLRLARAEETSSLRRAGKGEGDHHEAARLGEVVDERVEVWRTVAESREQRLVSTVSSDAMVALDHHDVAQLLDVTLDNAIRYAGDGAVVTVTTREAGDRVDLIVSDDGPGLDADDWDRAADRFWRGQTDVRGSGLGLSIAREIVEGQQGTFVLRRGPGGGAEVCFGLPLAGSGDR